MWSAASPHRAGFNRCVIWNERSCNHGKRTGGRTADNFPLKWSSLDSVLAFTPAALAFSSGSHTVFYEALNPPLCSLLLPVHSAELPCFPNKAGIIGSANMVLWRWNSSLCFNQHFYFCLMRYCLIRLCHFNYNVVTPDITQLTLHLRWTLTSTKALPRL